MSIYLREENSIALWYQLCIIHLFLDCAFFCSWWMVVVRRTERWAIKLSQNFFSIKIRAHAWDERLNHGVCSFFFLTFKFYFCNLFSILYLIIHHFHSVIIIMFVNEIFNFVPLIYVIHDNIIINLQMIVLIFQAAITIVMYLFLWFFFG